MAHDIARLEAYLAFAHRLADAAREVTLPLFRASEAIDKGEAGAFDPVTEADRGAERVMRALIESAYPEHGILGEEYGESPSRSGWTWTLDPVDGTRAFICGVPVWGTLIALAYEGVPVIGIIDQGYLDERYVGFPGGATATVRGATAPLKTRRCPSLSLATLAATDPGMFKGAETGGFEMVSRAARLTRYGLDCYGYAMLAAGRIDLVIESSLKPWDVQALYPIILGAGGVMMDWRGGPGYAARQVLAAGDEMLVEQSLVALRRAAD
jgi:histidinol phosphatase-like enzyme (inositol monophosphatase family)